jgi:GDPmannose 4,6-dehydratase
LQKHHHRAEHWIVVKGTAEITNGDKVMLLTENQYAEDFVIATGVQYSVRQFINWTAEALGMHLRWVGDGVNEVAYAVIPSQVQQSMHLCPADRPIVRIDPRYFRPTEVETLLGNPSKAKTKMGWVPEIMA